MSVALDTRDYFLPCDRIERRDDLETFRYDPRRTALARRLFITLRVADTFELLAAAVDTECARG